MNSDYALYNLAGLKKASSPEFFLKSSELGQRMGVSQQTASRYLKELEEEGLIDRIVRGRGQQVRLTESGLSRLKAMHSQLSALLQHKPPVIYGKAVSGIGEGAYYVRQYADRIEKTLGIKPYLGTLNLKYEGELPHMGHYVTAKIDGFQSGSRSLGALSACPVRLSYGRLKADCYIILPERTHHTGIIEILSEENLRQKFKIKDGVTVTVELIG
ncbi:MAG: DUF120 domain-containing protein [Candidatus Altiarchaeota archaeon]